MTAPNNKWVNGSFRPQVRMEFTIGSIVNLLAIVGAVTLWYGDLRERLSKIETKVEFVASEQARRRDTVMQAGPKLEEHGRRLDEYGGRLRSLESKP